MSSATRVAALVALAVPLAISLAVAVTLGGRARAQPGPTRLNVVVILSDDQRYDVSGEMPNVEHLLAAKGVTFSNAFVTTSECCPSRAGILTGQYSHSNGVVQNFGRANFLHFDQASNLAVWLHNAGYDTALVGKFLNDYPKIETTLAPPPGWSDWMAIDSVPEERYYGYALNENGHRVQFGKTPADYSTTVLTGKALQFIKRARKPFFLYFAPVTPHLPATPAPRDIGTVVPPGPDRPSFNERDLSDKPWRAIHPDQLHPRAIKFLEHDIRQRQIESLQALDRSVARIVRLLRKRNVLQRTVIFYMSDNGFLWGEHRLGGKIWPYEESIRVPLVVRVPWKSAWGARDNRMVLNIDLASTISALAGVQPALPQDGESFVPLLRREHVPWRHEFVVEYLGASQLREGGPPPFRAIRTQRYLYVEYLKKWQRWRELYDLRWDPWEDQNLAGLSSYASVERQLHTRLLGLFRRPPRPVG